FYAISYLKELDREANPDKVKAKVFISYKSEDYDWVRLIASELESKWYIPWFDRKRLTGGTPWWPEIEKEIDQSLLFLTFQSPWSSRAPGYHRNELERALEIQRNRGKFIIPLKLGEFSLPHSISELQAISLGDSCWLDRLIESIDEQVNL